MTNESCRCWAEIDCGALRQNFAAVRSRVGPAEVLAVVKANAYGHGMAVVAQTLANDAQLFGVANLEEAIALRAVVTHPILILGPATPEEREMIAQRGFIASVSTLEEAQAFDRLAGKRNVAVNFVVDTGMGRMGTPEKDALDVFKKVSALSKIKVHSVSSHLPVSNEDAQYTRAELERFAELVRRFRIEIPGEYKTHILPSAGVLAFNQTPFDIVRAGLILYGISPLPGLEKDLQPVLTWKTRIGLIRELPEGSSISYGRTFVTPRTMRVATLTAGYADGYPRHLSNRGTAVLIHGKRCALLGRVTMDLVVVDVTDVPDAEVGDEVVLLGRQGREEIPASELAERAETITWEITTRIGSRVRRVYT
jgi:alanine racemase